MFIWNNIFFSLGFDVKDHYKDLGGDAAAFVAPRNDLQGVKVSSDLSCRKLTLKVKESSSALHITNKIIPIFYHI
jgi:Clustered mitochondria